MSKFFDKKMEVCGFENLHNHSSYSLLDGVSEVEHAALKTKENNQQYLCFSDHGSLGSIPRAIRAAEKVGLTNIYSSELYVNDCKVPPEEIKNLPDEERQEASTSYHLLAGRGAARSQHFVSSSGNCL
jgi:DNA polymerase-3 subunit alpha